MVNKLVFFWEKYGYYKLPQEELRKIIEQHLKYNTLSYTEINNEIIAIVRYNIEQSTVKILDIVIRPDWRTKGLLRYMLGRDWHRFPYVTKIKYQRNQKPRKEERVFNMLRFLGVKK